MAQPEDFDAPEALLTPSEVAALFRVNPKTVTRWARAGKLTAIRTLGGHRRFRVSEIRRCLEAPRRSQSQEPQDVPPPDAEGPDPTAGVVLPFRESRNPLRRR